MQAPGKTLKVTTLSNSNEKIPKLNRIIYFKLRDAIRAIITI